jgi:hypothetical protein
MFFSSKSLSSKIDLFQSVLSDLYVLLNKEGEHNKHTDEEIQMEIEKFTFNQFYQWESNKPNNIVLRVNLDKLTPKFKDVILDSMKSFTVYLQNLHKSLKNEGLHIKGSYNERNIFNQKLTNILNIVDNKDIKHYIISHYLRMITDIDKLVDFHDDYGSENIYVVSVTVDMGKNIVKMYYRELYKTYLESVSDENNKMSYSN